MGRIKGGCKKCEGPLFGRICFICLPKEKEVDPKVVVCTAKR